MALPDAAHLWQAHPLKASCTGGTIVNVTSELGSLSGQSGSYRKQVRPRLSAMRPGNELIKASSQVLAAMLRSSSDCPDFQHAWSPKSQRLMVKGSLSVLCTGRAGQEFGGSVGHPVRSSGQASGRAVGPHVQPDQGHAEQGDRPAVREPGAGGAGHHHERGGPRLVQVRGAQRHTSLGQHACSPASRRTAAAAPL